MWLAVDGSTGESVAIKQVPKSSHPAAGSSGGSSRGGCRGAAASAAELSIRSEVRVGLLLRKAVAAGAPPGHRNVVALLGSV